MHLVQLAKDGYWIRIVVGHNLASGKAKVKVLNSEEAGVVSPQLRCITMATLESLRCSEATLSVVDRGHRHSSGDCESHFWLQSHPQEQGGVQPEQCTDRQAEEDESKAPAACPVAADAGEREVDVQSGDDAGGSGPPAKEARDPKKLHVDWLQAVLDQHSYRVARAMRSIDSESLSDSEFQVYAFFKPAASGAWSPWSAADKVGVKSLIGGDILHSCVHHWFAEDLVYLIYADLDGVT